MTQKVRRVALFETLPRDCLAEILFFFGTPKAWVAIQGTCKQLYSDLHHPETAWGMENVVFHLTPEKVHLNLRTFVSDKKEFVRNVSIEYKLIKFEPLDENEDDQSLIDEWNRVCASTIYTHNRIFEETLFFLLWQCPIAKLHLCGGPCTGMTLNGPFIEALSLPSCKITRLLMSVEMPDQIIPSILAKLPKLQELQISRIKNASTITQILEILRDNTRLQTLKFMTEEIYRSDLEVISKELSKSISILEIGGLAILDSPAKPRTELAAFMSAVFTDVLKTYKSLAQFTFTSPRHRVDFTKQFAEELAKNKTLKGLEVNMPQGSESLNTFMGAIATNDSLTHIGLAAILFFADDAEKFANAIAKNKKLVSLELSACGHVDGRLGKIVKALPSGGGLRELHFHVCTLSHMEVLEIASVAMTNGTVRVLEITGTDIGDEAALEIANLFKSPKCVLQTLNLCKSRDITLTGISNILLGAMKTPHLKKLDLSKCNHRNPNRLTVFTSKLICGKLLENSTLAELNLKKSFPDGYTIIRKALKEKASKSDFTFYL